MAIGICNLGGVRGEEQFFADLEKSMGVRVAQPTEKLLPGLVDVFRSAQIDRLGQRPFVPAHWGNR